MGYTSSQVKMRWMKQNYKVYRVQLRVEDDKDLIDFVEAHKDEIGTTELFRRAIEQLKRDGIKGGYKNE